MRMTPAIRFAINMFALSVTPTIAHAQVSIVDSQLYAPTSENIVVQRVRLDNFNGNTNSILYDVPFKFNPTTLNFEPILSLARPSDTSRCGRATITVTDGTTGRGINGATVSVVGRSVAANTSGVATMTGLGSGKNWVTVVAGNYAPQNRELDISCNNSTLNQFVYSLNPVTTVTKGQVRILLNWESDPEDLDAHLTGPDATGGRFHVEYTQRAVDVAKLDVEDLSFYGPESITITPPAGTSLLRPGVYRYSVAQFYGTSNIGASKARVRVIQDNGSERTYTPPVSTAWKGVNDVWTVFEINVSSDGRITFADINTVQNGISYKDVKSLAETGNNGQ